MKEEKTKGKKRLIYYLVLAVCVLLLAAATVLTVYFVTQGGDETLAEQPPVEDPDHDKDEPDPSEPSGGETAEFVSPVENASYTVEFDEIYENKTVNWWYRHKALDFDAAEGTAVCAIAAGTVETISESEETGNYIIINHGKNLRTMYRFVEAAEGLREGDKVEQSQKIGEVAAAYGSEYKDGTHLHLEMELDGTPVDPVDYLEPIPDEK